MNNQTVPSVTPVQNHEEQQISSHRTHKKRNVTLWTKKHVDSTWRHPEFSHLFRFLTVCKQNVYRYFQVHRAQYRLELLLYFDQYHLFKRLQIGHYFKRWKLKKIYSIPPSLMSGQLY